MVKSLHRTESQLSSKKINLGLRWRQPIQDDARRQTVIKLLKMLPLSDLRNLEFHNSDFQAEDWLSAFGNPKNLETICIRDNPSIVAALTPTADLERNWDVDVVANGSETEVTSVLFPGLKYLNIRAFAFNRRLIQRPTQQAIDVHDLQDCLIQRYERNAEIYRLRLTQCPGITQESITRLSEVVVDVNWDDENPRSITRR